MISPASSLHAGSAPVGRSVCVRYVRPVAAAWVVCIMTLAPAASAASARSLFTAPQAARGGALYGKHCAACHGDALQGGVAGALTGPAFAMAWGGAPSGMLGNWGASKLTVDDLNFVIRTTMPRGAPGTLAPEEYSAILAHVLLRNGYVAGKTTLRADSPRLKQMPLRFGTGSSAPSTPPVRIAGDLAAVPIGQGPTQQDLNNAADSTRDWLYHTHDYSGSRYVALDQINVQNAGRLRVVCAYQLGEESNFQTGPIVYQGTMYVTTARSTVALDATTCRQKWRHSWVPRANEVWRNNRGAAIKDGYLVRGTTDGYLLALNAKTGALIWAVQAADASQGFFFPMAPLLFEDLVLIGPAGSENGISGWVGAFRLSDGSPVWKFYTVPGATPTGSSSWGNPQGIKLGGGAVWTPFSLDAQQGQLFVPVTNPAPDLAARLRPGSNLYTNSVVALDVRTGSLVWQKQLVPNDSHDWDLTQVSPLFETERGGLKRQLLTTVGKDGNLRTLDRNSHETVYSTPVTTISNADAPVTESGTDTCPGVYGGVEWNGPALQRELSMLYVNAVDWCSQFSVARSIRHIPGHVYLGGSTRMLGESRGWLTALDAVTGEIKWRYASPMPMVAAVTTTKGDVVFTGELTGDFLAFDARDGTELYRFYTGGGIGGGIVTYLEQGKQYVAVMSGRPSAAWLGKAGGAPTVFLFSLP